MTKEEYERLAKRLVACPTTLEQDQKLWDSGMVTGGCTDQSGPCRLSLRRATEFLLFCRLAAEDVAPVPYCTQGGVEAGDGQDCQAVGPSRGWRAHRTGSCRRLGRRERGALNVACPVVIRCEV